jgi:hypothetical protein
MALPPDLLRLASGVCVLAELVTAGLPGALAASERPHEAPVILAQEAGMAPMMWDLNLPGLDFATYNLRTPDPRQCEQLCAQNPQCKAWTYVKPYTIQGPTPRCWLKNAVPRAQRNTCCVSGVKQQRR